MAHPQGHFPLQITEDYFRLHRIANGAHRELGFILAVPNHKPEHEPVAQWHANKLADYGHFLTVRLCCVRENALVEMRGSALDSYLDVWGVKASGRGRFHALIVAIQCCEVRRQCH